MRYRKAVDESFCKQMSAVAELKKICIIQPLLSSYSRETFLELAEYCEVDLVFSPTPAGTGFGDVVPPQNSRVRYFEVPTLKPFGDKIGMFQRGIAKYIFRERPDAILISGNPRYLTFWTTLLLGKLRGIPTYAHGHGLFKKHKIGVLYRLMMNVLLKLVTSYICYAPIVRQSFIDHGFPDQKLSVAHNSVINRFPVPPEKKTGKESGVLFIGRLREGSKLELLVRVMERLRRTDGLPLTLHVIGTGEQAPLLQKEAADRPWIILHGQIYDAEQVQLISRDCLLGCYPGNAGLSVEHLMSLSLPVVTHDDLSSHAGPEPSFIRNGVGGLLYDHRDPQESLYQAIKSLATSPMRLASMRQAAFEDYQHLVHPSLAARFWSILWAGPGGREFRSCAHLDSEALATSQSEADDAQRH
jgi:glycosyltransferase involved in cell wall biosynthesis